jgi:hypothetical protein
MYADAVGQARTASLIEIRTLQAPALLASGNKPGAVTALVEAVSLAGSQCDVRFFADEGAPMAALLGELVAAQRRSPSAANAIPLPYLGRLVRAVSLTPQSPLGAFSPSAPQPATLVHR